MSPNLALLLWLMLLTALLYFDPAKDRKVSISLWIPVVWLFILASRLPSQWLGSDVGQKGAGVSAQMLAEGNPLDRAISSALILMAVAVLLSRSFNWSDFFGKNITLVAFLSFALLSVVWSDFVFVAFKRWFRDVGNYLVVLVVLSDPRPQEAVRTVLRRLSYLLVPLSILLDKYFPQLGKQYDVWTGVGSYIGVATSKNMLGLLCLVSGLFFSWDTVTRWPSRKQRRTKRIILINVIFLAMTISLLRTSQSTTSGVCLLLGIIVIISSQSNLVRRRPGLLRALIPASFCIYLILDFVFGLSGSMAQAVGKDPTLHDRTKIWAFLLGMHTNPLIGTGYQSFWLGPRLEWFWSNAYLGHINEAHNGYLEVYLELGLIGVALFIAFLIASYRSMWTKRGPSSEFAVFGLAVWMTLLFYNMSEAAFEGGLMYSVFLLTAITVRAPKQVLARGSSGRLRHQFFVPKNASAALTTFSTENDNQRR